MLTLIRIQTTKGPRVLTLRDLDPAAHSELVASEATSFTIDSEERWARYDRRTRSWERAR